MNEAEIRAELIGLLRYANKTAIAEQLGVSPQAVKNWSEGKHPSEDRLNAIKRLYGLPATSHGITKEAAPPSLEERLRRIELYVEAIAGATPGVDAEQIADIHRRVLELERARQPHDEPRRSAGLDAQDEPSGTAR